MKVFVARQPIIDLRNEVWGYEFLYRDSKKNCYNADVDGSVATRRLISNLITEFGLEKTACGRLAFLNFTEDLILSQYPTYLSRPNVVLEILEDVKPSDFLMERIKSLREQGYRFALDDYIGGENAFLEHVDIIKVDFAVTSRAVQAEIAERYRCGDKCLLAEKIETDDDYRLAKEMGYSYFQGFYFSKPVLMTKSVVQITTPVYWRVWEEANKPYPSFDELVRLIELDAGFAYQFLTSTNGAYSYRGNIVTTVRQAIIKMGLKQMRRRLLLLSIKNIMLTDNIETTKLALSRALFCESIARAAQKGNLEEDAYVVGLFSLLDTMMEADFNSILCQLNLDERVKAALTKHEGFLGELLQFACAYENADWETVEAFIQTYGVDSELVGNIYYEAITNSDRLFSQASQDSKENS